MQNVAALPRAPEPFFVPVRFLTSTRASSAEQRLTLLMQAHFDFVWRSLRRLGLSPADADDASQEVFLVASRKLDSIAAGSERSFLFGSALKVASTRRRSLKRRPELAQAEVEERDEQSAPGPERLTELSRARQLLQAVLDDMPLELKAPFVLFELEELSVPQIAELLQLPVGTVSSRLRNARLDFQAAVRRLQARDAFAGRAR
ncbi:MAG: sigma-70 family RNA polymerase sigma factor [Myxococcales bacterium]